MNTKVGTNWKGVTVGHRVPWHEKCGRMHGHNLRVRVEVEGELDFATGMVVDFGVLSKDLAEVIEPWDHKFLAARDAKLVPGIAGFLESAIWVEQEKEKAFGPETFRVGESFVIDEKYVLPKDDVVVLPLNLVTSENLAWHVLYLLIGKAWAPGKVVRVQISENGENIAEASMFVPASTGSTAASTVTSTYPWNSNCVVWMGTTNNATVAPAYSNCTVYP